MGNPRTEGRMIRRQISDSKQFAALSPEAAVLFVMIIPQLNSHGKLNGGPGFIKDEVCPRVSYLTVDNLPALLEEISEKTDIKWFCVEERYYIQALKFDDHQKLDKTKVGKDLLPSYSGVSRELVQSKSGVSRELVGHKEEVKVEVKVEEEVKATRATDHLPVDNCEPLPDLEPGGEQEGPLPDIDQGDGSFYEKLKTTMATLTKIYPNPFDQRSITLFIESAILKMNHDAIIHALDALIKSDKAGRTVKNLRSYLDAIITVESQNYNAAAHEKKSEEFKKPIPPEGMMAIGTIMALAMKQKTQAMKNRGHT